MKTRKLLFLLLFMVPFFAFSQSQKDDVKLNRFWDNWFVSGGVGGQMFLGEDYTTKLGGKSQQSSLFSLDYWTPAVNFSVGKWFTPVVGSRIQLGGLGFFCRDQRPGGTIETENFRYGKYNVQYFNVHGDVMFNLNNLFAGYNPDRFFSISPFLGVGYEKTLKIVNKDSKAKIKQNDNGNLSFNAGLLFGFRLSDALDLNLELQGAVIGDNFNGYIHRSPYDGLVAATVGVTYKFKKRGFESCPGPDESEILRLLDENYRLRDELNACLTKPVPPCPPCLPGQPCPPCPPCPKEDCPSAAIGVVKFALASAVIAPDQRLNVFNAAEYLKNNPGVKLQVVGYADVKTGKAASNLKLSEKRAKAVAKMLVNKYGIPENRIEISWNGDKVQPFEVNEWNRVVIFVPQK